MAASVKASAEEAARRLMMGLGANLVAVALFGHLEEGHAAPGVGANLLIVVTDASVAALRPIAAVVADWTARNGDEPLIVTEKEWRASADVFPLEIEDMRAAHTLLAGRDPFAGLVTARADLRRQLEREVRGKLLQLRAEYAAAAPKGKALEGLLAGSAGTFLVLFRATLRLAGQSPPAEARALVVATATVAGFEADAFDWALSKLAGARPAKLEPFDAVAGRYLGAVERLARYVDEVAVASA